MSCVTMHHKIVDGHLHFILMLDDDTFQYSENENPENYFDFKALIGPSAETNVNQRFRL